MKYYLVIILLGLGQISCATTNTSYGDRVNDTIDLQCQLAGRQIIIVDNFNHECS